MLCIPKTYFVLMANKITAKLYHIITPGSVRAQDGGRGAFYPSLKHLLNSFNNLNFAFISKVGHWLNNSVVSRIARGPGFESRSGHGFFLPCDIWWLSVGSRLGQRASKSACLVVPLLFRADTGMNLFKQGENIKGRPLAQ